MLLRALSAQERLTLALSARRATSLTKIKHASQPAVLIIKHRLMVSVRPVRSPATSVKEQLAHAQAALLTTSCTLGQSVSNTAPLSTKKTRESASTKVSYAPAVSSSTNQKTAAFL